MISYIAILDWMLPELTKLEIWRLRAAVSSVAVILLTPKDEVSDRVAGLDAGTQQEKQTILSNVGFN